jgi:hypothetical protein
MKKPLNEVVLLIEDNDDHAELAEFYIKNYDDAITVLRLPDGAAAMDYLADVKQSKQAVPWLVILDLKLPKYNGHEILNSIKSNKALLSIPVIIFSTSANQQDVEQAYAMHANSYLVKPMESDGYEGIVNKLLDYWSIDQHYLLTAGQN